MQTQGLQVGDKKLRDDNYKIKFWFEKGERYGKNWGGMKRKHDAREECTFERDKSSVEESAYVRVTRNFFG